MCYIHLACRAAKQRRVHSCRRKRRSANSVAASLPRRSVAAQTASAASLQRRSVAAPTASQRGSRVAASQRQQRRSVAPACVAAPTASQRTALPAPGSVAASQRHPPPRASQRRSATRPRERHSATSETHVSAPFAPALILCCRTKGCHERYFVLPWPSCVDHSGGRCCGHMFSRNLPKIKRVSL